MHWLKAFLLLAGLTVMSLYAPAVALDPWGLFKLNKIFSMLLVLSLIHFIGALLIRVLGEKVGLILGGLIGGFVSSTALTASLAKKSQKLNSESTHTESITYLAATLAMLMEAAVLTTVGSADTHIEIYLIFAAPALVTLVLILIAARNIKDNGVVRDNPPLIDFLSSVKLAIFIFTVLGASKALQIYFGQNGPVILTFLVSLFEIHGSVIANIQLHEAGSIDSGMLVSLLCISILASYLSKLFLVYSIGSNELKLITLKWTALILGFFLVSWGIVYAFY